MNRVGFQDGSGIRRWSGQRNTDVFALQPRTSIFHQVGSNAVVPAFLDTALGFGAVILRPFGRNARPFWPSEPHPTALRHQQVIQGPLSNGFLGALSRSSRPLGRRGDRVALKVASAVYRPPWRIRAGVSFTICVRRWKQPFPHVSGRNVGVTRGQTSFCRSLPDAPRICSCGQQGV